MKRIRSCGLYGRINIRRMLFSHMFILRKKSIKKKRYQGVFDIAFSFPCVL